VIRIRARIAAIVLAGALASAGVNLGGGLHGQSASPSPQVEVVARDLEVPWALDFAPDGRMFVTERAGRIRVIRNGRLDLGTWQRLFLVELSLGEVELLDSLGAPLPR
jgi:glucose/arabinose dehydrogenase